MSITEKVAYLKGLAEGMKVGDATNEGKLITEIIATLEDICDKVDAIDDAQIEFAEQLDAVDEDLSAVEDIIYDDDDDCDGDCENCDEDCDFDDDDEVYEVTCPKCNDTIYIDNEMLDEGSINCPNCGEVLEFDFDECDGDCSACDDSDCSERENG